MNYSSSLNNYSEKNKSNMKRNNSAMNIISKESNNVNNRDVNEYNSKHDFYGNKLNFNYSVMSGVTNNKDNDIENNIEYKNNTNDNNQYNESSNFSFKERRREKNTADIERAISKSKNNDSKTINSFNNSELINRYKNNKPEYYYNSNSNSNPDLSNQYKNNNYSSERISLNHSLDYNTNHTNISNTHNMNSYNKNNYENDNAEIIKRERRDMNFSFIPHSQTNNININQHKNNLNSMSKRTLNNITEINNSLSNSNNSNNYISNIENQQYNNYIDHQTNQTNNLQAKNYPSTIFKNYEESLLTVKQARIVDLEIQNKEFSDKNTYLESKLKQITQLNSKNQISANEEINHLLSQLRAKDDELDSLYKQNSEYQLELESYKNKTQDFSDIINNLKFSFNQKINEIEDFTIRQEQVFKENEVKLIREINILKEDKNSTITGLLSKHEIELERICGMNENTKTTLINLNKEKDEDYIKLMNEYRESERRLGDIIKKQNKQIEEMTVKIAECKCYLNNAIYAHSFIYLL